MESSSATASISSTGGASPLVAPPLTGRTQQNGVGPTLYEFLLEAELAHYYKALASELKVGAVHQLKYVKEEDLCQLGMTKPEQRRLRKFFHKYHPPHTYLHRIKKMILPKLKDDQDRLSLLIPESSSSTSGEKSAVRSPSRHIISADSIVINKQLGVGEFGVVEQGVWTNEDGERIQVAIKCLSKEKLQNNNLEFLKEAAIMHSIDHDHIVRLYGVVLDTNALMLVTELAPLRSLLECLKEPAVRSSFPVPALCDFALQVCQGMAYLEAKRLIHRDLAARNILVFGKHKVKISDFGLSRALGVGKDYYQTNFNVNLKLPIAWCAPECINFLKFTSASDVWAYGVTLWEMFSYGFQPWAALTGQQILEAIDEPNFQRLEQPECCPKEYYSLMLRCWQHDLNKRPKFAEILTVLPECKPEQVQAVKDCLNPASKGKKDMLQYRVGDVIIVLDKRPLGDSGQLWKGALLNGKTGLFNPTNSVAYLGQNLPTSTCRPSFSRADAKATLYASKRRLCPEMISRPKDDLRHTGHVGLDGAFFGDVTFLGDKYQSLPKQVVAPYKPQNDKDPSLNRVPSDLSDKTPLLIKSNSINSESSTSTGPVEIPNNVRDPEDSKKKEGKKNDGGIDHEYHEISDDESLTGDNLKFGSFDLGPSFYDEVFKALTSTSTLLTSGKSSDPPLPSSPTLDVEESQPDTNNVKNEIKEITSKLIGKESSKKKQALVKPISATDEQTLNSAIAMAKELATKSMLEQDKAPLEKETSSPSLESPKSPNTPTKKKFPFIFKGSSPKVERRNFSQEAEAIPSIQDSLSESAKEAYASLVEKGSHLERNVISHPLPGSLISHRSAALPSGVAVSSMDRVSASSKPPAGFDDTDAIEENPLRALRQGGPVRPRVRGNKNGTSAAKSSTTVSASLPATTSERSAASRPLLGMPPPPPPSDANPLPLPPRDRSKPLPVLKHHERKHPLILPGTASLPANPSPNATGPQPSNKLPRPPEIAPKPDLPRMPPAPSSSDASKIAPKPPSHLPVNLNDSFESRIEAELDSLDDIPEEEPPSPPLYKNEDHVSCEDLLEFALDKPNAKRTQGRAQGTESDEVRIMLKVLDNEKPPAEKCLWALNQTEWEVHKAIKLLQLWASQPHAPEDSLCDALVKCGWDVQQAVSLLHLAPGRGGDTDEDTTEV